MEQIDTTLQQLMFSLVEVWKTSGKTQVEFCKEKDIAYHKFHYWFKKYNQSNQATEARPGFRRILVSEKVVGTGSVEIIYPDGRKLIFHQPVEASFLRGLLN